MSDKRTPEFLRLKLADKRFLADVMGEHSLVHPQNSLACTPRFLLTCAPFPPFQSPAIMASHQPRRSLAESRAFVVVVGVVVVAVVAVVVVVGAVVVVVVVVVGVVAVVVVVGVVVVVVVGVVGVVGVVVVGFVVVTVVGALAVVGVVASVVVVSKFARPRV